MVKKVKTTQPEPEQKVQEEQGTKQAEESLTIKEKKQHEQKLKKAIKKMGAKIKKNLDKKQIIKAVKALQDYSKHIKEQDLKKKLLESEDQQIQVTFTLTQLPEKPTPKPMQVKIPHPFNTSANNTRVCVFVKDPAREFKDEIQDLKIPCIAKVIGYSKLKKNYKQFKDKRQLLKDYDLFLADLRIYKMLPECLGKEFYSKKKYPCPIKLHGFEGKELQKQLNKASQSTFFIQGNGPNYSLKVGLTTQDPQEVADNIELALAQALAYVSVHDDIKFSKVQQISVKVGESPELPIFNQLQKSEVEAYFASQQ